MKRVVVSNPMCGICHMQVCAVMDASDTEILDVCNKENPSGTSNGWSQVIRGDYVSSFWPVDKLKPVPCNNDKERMHFLVAC